MGVRNAIRKIAESSGKSEAQLLMDTLEQCNHEQKFVAQLLGVSQPAVSEAIKRNGFRLVKRYEVAS